MSMEGPNSSLGSGGGPNRRATPDPALMLAYIEGDLSTVEELRFRRSLGAAPEVLLRLDAMKRDRAALRSALLPEPLVPRALDERVDRSLAREALIAPGDGLAVPHAADLEPVAVAPALGEPLRFRRWNSTRIVTAASMAAALALVAGGLLLTLNPSDRVGHAPGGTPLAAAPETDVHRGENDAAASAIAANPGSTSEGLADPSHAERSISAAGPAGPVVPIDALDAHPVPSTRLLPGVVARADLMSLAEQHRLALRISSDQPREVVSALERAAQRAEEGGSARAPWRMRADAPTSLASSIGLSLQPMDEQSPATVAAPIASAPDPLPPGVTERERWLLRPTDDALAVYLAEVDLSEAALNALQRDLERQTTPSAEPASGAAPDESDTDAGFAALADPLDRVLDDATLLVPAGDVIWWYQPPRRWAKRTLVPVIVEPKR